jgi:hypothetical protein
VPTLTVTKTYQDGDILLEADLDAMRSALHTFFNTTKIDDDNIQNAGITRATKLKLGTANHVVINDGTGAMSSEASLAVSRGGTGLSLSLGAGDANKVMAVNSGGSALELRDTPESPISRIYAFNNFA